MSALELELVKEKSTALGLAGKTLQSSIVKYQQSVSRNGVTLDERDRLLAAVAANIQALVIQRELVGLIHDNMQWLVQTYDIPTEALARLGVVPIGPSDRK